MNQSFTVTGMTCGHCEAAVTRAIKQIDGGAQVRIDRAANLVEVDSTRPRELGFSMAEIAELVALWQDRQRASADVKRLAQAHVRDLEQRIAALQAMRRTLQNLLRHCHGDARPDCPILDELAGH